MVGGALARHLRQCGFRNVLTPSRSELPLLDYSAVCRYFERSRPESVFMCAAMVGGIAANLLHPATFLSENLQIQLNLFNACMFHGARKNVFLGSSCIYPRECPQPMKEQYLLTGPLEPTNEGYALAKIAGVKLAASYWREFGLRTICPMPCNVYGTGDHFELERAHVVPAMVCRFVDATDARTPEVTLWGTGTARREFIHVADLARALLLLFEQYDSPEIINVGTGTDVSIRELAMLVAEAAGYAGNIGWDRSKPDGMPRKCLDVSRLSSLGFQPAISLREGIAMTVREYRAMKRQGRTG